MSVLAQMACCRFTCILIKYKKIVIKIAYTKPRRQYRYLRGLCVNSSLRPQDLSGKDHLFSRSLEPCTRITFPLAGPRKTIKMLVFIIKCLRIFLCRKNSWTNWLFAPLPKSSLKQQTLARICMCCLRKYTYAFETEHQYFVCIRILCQVVYQRGYNNTCCKQTYIFQSRKKKPRRKSGLHQNTISNFSKLNECPKADKH